MSQALKNFENHQFRKTWQSFKDEFNKRYIPEQINDPVRLENYDIINKKIEFIDNWLSLVDPELGHDTILNNANTYVSNAKSNINSEQTYISRNDNRNAMNSLNSCINNIGLCVIEIFKLPVAIPKVTSNSITRMLNNYRDTIQQALEEINLEKTKNDASDIENYKQKLIDNNDSISKTIEKEFKEIEDKYNKINNFYNELLIDEQNKTSTKQQVVNGKNEILEYIKQIKEQHSEFNTKLDEFERYYVKIFGSYNKETQKRENGLKQELENRKKQLEEMEKKHNEKYQAMFNQINSLLEGATNVGLAKAFRDEKKQYLKPIKCWNIAFIVTIILLLVWGGLLIYFSEIWNANKNIASVFLRTLLVTTTLIWFAIYASKRRSENQRFKQEYAHKEAVAKSYNSYKKQIEELGTDEKEKLLSQLMSATIETIAYNPSQTLDKKHGDGTVLDEISKPVRKFVKSVKQ